MIWRMARRFLENDLGEIVALVYWAGIIACIVLIVIQWVNSRRLRWHVANHPDEPQCANCGYVIRTGSSTVCSECGRDVRVSGLITARTSRRPHAGPWFFLAALLGMPIALYVAFSLMWFPVGWDYHINYHLRPLGADAADNWRHWIHIQASGTGRYFANRPEYINIHTMIVGQNGGGQMDHVVHIRPSDVMAQEWNKAEMNVVYVPFSREFVTKWIGTLDFETQSQHPEDAADKLVTMVHAIANGKFPSHNYFERETTDQVSYQLNDFGRWALLSFCYMIILAVLFVLSTFSLRRIDKRITRRWHEEIDRLKLIAPGGNS